MPLTSPQLIKKASLNTALESAATRIILANPVKNYFPEEFLEKTYFSISKLNNNVVLRYKFEGRNYSHMFKL